MIKKKKLVITGFVAAMAACLTVGVGTIETNAETAATYLAYGEKWNYSVDYMDGFATLGLDGGVSVDGMREGNAPFGFATYGQYDFMGGTQFAEAQDKQQIHHVYTTEFTVTEAKNALKLQMIYDDGIAVYLDGQEIYRDNIVGYDFTAVTEADALENSVGVAKETVFYLSMAEGALAAQSEHRITVITAQDFKNGNDAYFNMQISGVDGFTPQDNDLPDTISLTYYSDPFTTRGVTYYTGLSLRHTDAKYREVGATEWTCVPSEGEAWYGRLCHKVAFMDLKENTKYEYALGNELLGVWGKTYTFETAASATADESFKFSYLTDTQSSDAWQFRR